MVGRGNSVAGPFVVDDITTERLGPVGLDELAANLWPHECQTCGNPLAGARPTVYVKAFEDIATATLHHLDCRSAGWDDNPQPSSDPAAATVNFVARPVLVPTVVERSGAEVWRPFLLVNPGLEQVILAVKDDGWRVATTNYYAQYGLGSGGEIMRVDMSVPNAIATLDDEDVVTVWLGDLRAGWAGECHPATAAAIREMNGVALGVSTAFHPAHDVEDLIRDFADAISIGQVAGGWVPLTSPRN